MLDRLLGGCERQSCDQLEVVVVRAGGSEDPGEVTDRHPTVDVRTTDVPGAGSAIPYAPARNHGAAVARGDVLAFCDADTIPSSGFVAAMTAALADHDALADRGGPLPASRCRGRRRRAAAPPVLGSPPRPRPGPGLRGAAGRSGRAGVGPVHGRAPGHLRAIRAGSTSASRATPARTPTWPRGLDRAGVPVALVGGATVFHQHHDWFDPPVQQLEATVANARQYRRTWGRWPMEGWLAGFAAMGLVDWDPTGDRCTVLRTPTPAEVESCRRTVGGALPRRAQSARDGGPGVKVAMIASVALLRRAALRRRAGGPLLAPGRRVAGAGPRRHPVRPGGPAGMPGAGPLGTVAALGRGTAGPLDAGRRRRRRPPRLHPGRQRPLPRRRLRRHPQQQRPLPPARLGTDPRRAPRLDPAHPAHPLARVRPRRGRLGGRPPGVGQPQQRLPLARGPTRRGHPQRGRLRHLAPPAGPAVRSGVDRSRRRREGPAPRHRRRPAVRHHHRPGRTGPRHRLLRDAGPPTARTGPSATTGTWTRARAAELVAGAAVSLVTPTWPEPFGLVVAESLACGTPVAGFASGALPELVDDEVARLVPEGDVAALAEAAVEAAALDARACRRVAEERFGLDRMIADYERTLVAQVS